MNHTSPNVTADVYHLTTLAPVRPEGKPALTAYLRTLPDGAQSPFAAVPGTHFARLIVLDHFGASVGPGPRIPLDPPRLLFAADIDGSPDHYVASLCQHITGLAVGIWSHCVGYPGTGDPQRFARWLRSYEVDAALPFATVTGATAAEIVGALEIRTQLADFAVHAQGLQPDQLRKLWTDTFGL